MTVALSLPQSRRGRPKSKPTTTREGCKSVVCCVGPPVSGVLCGTPSQWCVVWDPQSVVCCVGSPVSGVLCGTPSQWCVVWDPQSVVCCVGPPVSAVLCGTPSQCCVVCVTQFTGCPCRTQCEAENTHLKTNTQGICPPLLKAYGIEIVTFISPSLPPLPKHTPPLPLHKI